MTKKERFLAAVRGEAPDVVPVAPLIHCRFAHKVLGRSDWQAVFEVHQRIGSVHHRGPVGVGVRSSLPDGYGSETRELERAPDGRVTSEWLIHTPKRTLRGKTVSGMIPHDPLVGKTANTGWRTPRGLPSTTSATSSRPWATKGCRAWASARPTPRWAACGGWLSS